MISKLNIFCVLLISLSFLFSCGTKNDGYIYDINNYYGKEESIADFNKTLSVFKDTSMNDVFVFFASNPFKLDSSFKLVIYDKNTIVYYGPYKEYLYIRKPIINEQNLAYAEYTILICKSFGDKMRSCFFKNDKSFKWLNEYKCIYIEINPENAIGNNVFLYPTIEKIYL